MSKIKDLMLEPQVVKIQQSIYSSDGIKSILVKSKDGLVRYQETEPNAVNAIVDMLKGRDKAYFMAQIIPNKINILEEIVSQPW